MGIGRLMSMVLAGIRVGGIGWELNRRSHPRLRMPGIVTQLRYGCSTLFPLPIKKNRTVYRRPGIKEGQKERSMGLANRPTYGWNLTPETLPEPDIKITES